MRLIHVAASALVLAGGMAIVSPARATFILDTSCGVSSCAAGTKLFVDKSNKNVSTFAASVGGHVGPAVTVTTTGNVDTGGGFATITPAKDTTLTDLIFAPADDTLFNDFSFRGSLEPSGFTGVIDVTWTDSMGNSGTISFTVPKANQDYDALGIVSTDGETLEFVEITTPGSESFKMVKQVEFSFATPPPPPVPEPATLALLGTGLVGLGLLRRRKA